MMANTMRSFNVNDHVDQEAVAAAGLYGIKQCFNVLSDKLILYKDQGIIDESGFVKIETWYHDLLKVLLDNTSLSTKDDIDKFTAEVKAQLEYAINFESNDALKLLKKDILK